ncbi:MAG: anthranilate synthase component II [Muribaculaceae bacterium]
MKIVIIDNYDSFTYNLFHIIRDAGAQVDVKRNDRFELSEINNYDKIVLSPGPGIPDEAGLLKQVIETYKDTKPMLGVCLGHQAIGEVFGAKLVNLDEVYHGIQSDCHIVSPDYIFEGLPNKIDVGRYHSWVVDSKNFPAELEITAVSDKQEIMALRHRKYDIHGIQFHPESVLTPDGRQIIYNFLKK